MGAPVMASRRGRRQGEIWQDGVSSGWQRGGLGVAVGLPIARWRYGVQRSSGSCSAMRAKSESVVSSRSS